MYIRHGLSFEAGERFRLHCERETDPKDVRSIGRRFRSPRLERGSFLAYPFVGWRRAESGQSLSGVLHRTPARVGHKSGRIMGAGRAHVNGMRRVWRPQTIAMWRRFSVPASFLARGGQAAARRLWTLFDRFVPGRGFVFL